MCVGVCVKNDMMNDSFIGPLYIPTSSDYATNNMASLPAPPNSEIHIQASFFLISSISHIQLILKHATCPFFFFHKNLKIKREYDLKDSSFLPTMS